MWLCQARRRRKASVCESLRAGVDQVTGLLLLSAAILFALSIRSCHYRGTNNHLPVTPYKITSLHSILVVFSFFTMFPQSALQPMIFVFKCSHCGFVGSEFAHSKVYSPATRPNACWSDDGQGRQAGRHLGQGTTAFLKVRTEDHLHSPNPGIWCPSLVSHWELEPPSEQ